LPINALAFSRDGLHFAIGGFSQIRVYETNPPTPKDDSWPELIRYFRTVTAASLTPEERHNLLGQ
jgi:hypothetical protein